ncbi:unnamed protein product [Bursaphelenchus xylophilus]|uniref:(pine wood nematode) hypothetical protein n=1 Tax=Bursaphelenchus xylophilus TaxID=6326 RepID=A0A1I7RUQ5_BURXY|nr:unnamed protein product [Bursaphelenchus xylophilus]CAG9114322.1 unnamed protein product [Bursaphelenchus xylophilus]
MWCLFVLPLISFPLLQAYKYDVQGYIVNEDVGNFTGYPYVKVVLVDHGVFYDTICGETIARADGYFHIQCDPTDFRFDDVQLLKIYHRFEALDCRVNVYRGRGRGGMVESKNYDALKGDELEKDESLCPEEIYKRPDEPGRK